MEVQYVTKIPGKAIINGAYLVLNDHTCVAVTPNAYSLSYVKKSLAKVPIIKITTNFADEALFTYKKLFTANGNVESSMLYCQDIINYFYQVTGNVPKEEIDIFISLDQSLFSVQKKYISESIKTGLGSSGVFLIAIVDALLPSKISETKFFELCRDINLLINKVTSCCDIAASLFGSIVYKKYEYERIKFTSNYVLVLGSFNKSTNTRYMIEKITEDEKWNELSEINSKIIGLINSKETENIKDMYKEYLRKLRSISNAIVPDKQFEILNNTFKYDIFGCGVSGSGGEDAVWCIVDRKSVESVVFLWKKHFEYVIVHEKINCDPFIYNIEVETNKI